jgi:hypothetical protein
MPKLKKQAKHEIRTIVTTKGGNTVTGACITVLSHLLPGAKALCNRIQDGLDKEAIAARVYLFTDNIPVYAAYGIEEKRNHG